MSNETYGYARVSAKDQNEARQMDAMALFGIEKRKIYLDKQSGRNFERPQYKRLMRRLKEGDRLVIKSIDRLGRDYEEILEQWRKITREKKANIIVLDMPLLNTDVTGDLTGVLIADIVLQILSYMAQKEREMIHQRQAEGIAAAKARGVRFGPKPRGKPEAYERCLGEWKAGKISAREAGRRLGVAHKTFLQWARM